MCKNFLLRIYRVLLFLLLYTSGCQVAGGGGSFHIPPKKIICDTQWTIIMKFSVVPVDPKEKYGKLAERYKNVTIHIRDSVNSNFIDVPMVIKSVNPEVGELQFIADMKSIPCDSSIEYVEYYIDEMFDRSYNRTELYRVPVIKN